jgi:hypothetical protein
MGRTRNLRQAPHHTLNRTQLASKHPQPGITGCAYSLTSLPPKGNDLLATFSLKLLQSLLRFGAAFSRRGTEQDAGLVTVAHDALAMPVEIGERDFRAGVPLLHGNPEQPHGLWCFHSGIFPAQELHGLDVLSLASIVTYSGKRSDRRRRSLRDTGEWSL